MEIVSLTTNKILSNILLSRLTPCAEEIIGDHQCGFQSNRSTADHIFCTFQILEKKWEFTKTGHHPLIQLGGTFCLILPYN
jgi:hypothetical protein